MKRCITAFSDRSTERGRTDAFDDVYPVLFGNGAEPLMIIFSSDYDNFGLYTDLMHKNFPSAQIIGMTAFTGCSAEGFSDHALAALAVYEGIECAGGVFTDANRYPIRHKDEAVNAAKAVGADNNSDNVCCLEFVTAFGSCEELVIDTFKAAFDGMNIPVFGSTAGVRRGTRRSQVSLNGIVYEDACVFLLVKNLAGRISVISENAYRPTRHVFCATNVDCERRVLSELDNRPAVPHIASALGADIPDFVRNVPIHPLGRIYGDKIYIAECAEVSKTGSLVFYSHIYNYSKLVLLEPDDPKHVTDRFIGSVSGLGYKPSFSLAVNCVFDYDMFEGKGFEKNMIRSLSENCGCFLGVSGCGEQTDMLHVNKTLLLCAFE